MSNFKELYHLKRIPEWGDYYINYSFLNNYLELLKKFREKTTVYLMDELITNIDDEEFKYIEELRKNFHHHLVEETQKFNQFYRFVFDNSIKIKFFKIILNLQADEKTKNFQEKKENKRKIKEALERYYKEVNQLKQYVSLNFKIIYQLMRRYKQTLTDIEIYDDEFISNYNNLLANSFVLQNVHRLKKVQLAIQKIYLDIYYPYSKEEKGKEALRKIAENVQVSSSESVRLGFYVGFFLVTFIITIIILIEVKFFDSEGQTDFIIYQFPIFRGSLLFFLYQFFLGVNVYLWEKYNINYKRVFGIQMHHSTPYQIFKRTFAFLCVWMITFLYCSISYIYNGNKFPFLNKTLEKYLPPFVWIVFLIYLCFPFKVFNWKGRLFFFKTLKDMALSPFQTVSFVVSFCTDQFLSLFIPLRDIYYTICYSIHLTKTGEIKNECSESPLIYFEMIFLFVPLLYRIIQCLQKSQRMNGINRKNQLFNALKYTITLATTFIGLAYFIENVYWLWIIMIIITTLYSYFWDINKDWGFLQPNSKNKFLRNKLYNPHFFYYYTAIIIDFGLRLSWIITISPGFWDRVMYVVLIKTTLGILEIFRRCIWNYFKVEFENLKYELDFHTIEGFHLPFEIEIDQKDEKMRQLVDQLFQTQIDELKMNKDEFALMSKNFNVENSKKIISKYLEINNLKLSKSLQKHLNKSMDLQQLEDFYHNYNLKIDKLKEVINQHEENLSQKNVTKISIVHEDKKNKSGFSSFNQGSELSKPQKQNYLQPVKSNKKILQLDDNFEQQDNTLFQKKKQQANKELEIKEVPESEHESSDYQLDENKDIQDQLLNPTNLHKASFRTNESEKKSLIEKIKSDELQDLNEQVVEEDLANQNFVKNIQIKKFFLIQIFLLHKIHI